MNESLVVHPCKRSCLACWSDAIFFIMIFYNDCHLTSPLSLILALNNGRHSLFFSHQPVEEGAVPQHILTMSVVINNISRTNDQKVCLGGVAYADSFLVSSIKYGNYD